MNNLNTLHDITTFENQGDLVFLENESSNGGAAINNVFLRESDSERGSEELYLFNNQGNVVFENNKAILNSNGGAINHNMGGNSLTGKKSYTNKGNVEFRDNSTEAFGGAIYNYSNHVSSVNSDEYANDGHVLFENNYAGD